jgi:hypothetical protein
MIKLWVQLCPTDFAFGREEARLFDLMLDFLNSPMHDEKMRRITTAQVKKMREKCVPISDFSFLLSLVFLSSDDVSSSSFR